MAPLYPILNRWIPRRYLFTGGMVSMIIGYTMLALFSSNLPVVIVALIFFYVPAQFIQMTAILSLTDSIEYGQLKNGKRNEGGHLVGASHARQDRRRDVNGAVGAVALAAGMTGHATAADMTASTSPRSRPSPSTSRLFSHHPSASSCSGSRSRSMRRCMRRSLRSSKPSSLPAEIVDDEGARQLLRTDPPVPIPPIRPVRLNRKMRSVADGPVPFLRSAVMNIYPCRFPAVGPEPAA